MRVKIKPLSANKAWQGRRFKTDEYKKYEQDLNLLLPHPQNYHIPKGKIGIRYEFGLSNKLSDIDNPIKQFQDILTKRYDFKDSDIYELQVIKKIVKKGEEYIDFHAYTLPVTFFM